MPIHALATLDPVDPSVRAEAQQLALRLADDPSRDTQVNRAVRSLLDKVVQGDRVVVLREEETLTPSQAAEMMGVTRQFVDRLMNDGVLPFHRLPGSTHRRVTVADVLAARAERERRRAGHVALLDALADADLLDNA